MLQWYYLAIISAVLMGFSTLLEKRVLKKEYASAYSASFAVLTAVLSLVLIPFANFSMSMLDVVLVYVVSLEATIGYLLTARIYRHSDISASTPVKGVLPIIFLVLFAFFFLGEKLGPVQYAGIGITLVSTYFLLFRPGKHEKYFKSAEYKYLIVVVSLLMAGGGVLFKYLLYTVNVYAFMILVEVFMAFNMVAYMIYKYGGMPEIVSSMRTYKKELTAIVLLTFAYRLTFYLAVPITAISLVSPLRNAVFTMMVVMLGGVMFGEKNIKAKALLSLGIIAGAAMLVL